MLSTSMAVSKRPSREKVHHRDEQGGSHDRPQHRKGMVVDADDEHLGQVEPVRDERSEQRAHKTHSDGDDKTAASAASDGAAQRAADSSNEQQDQEASQREVHGGFFLVI